jgi:hypothetical protein
MARRRGPPSQGWRTFLRNHADGIPSMDLFVVPTISFRLCGLLILRHDRRRILWIGVTAHPTAEWIARQVVEVSAWERISCAIEIGPCADAFVTFFCRTQTITTPCARTCRWARMHLLHVQSRLLAEL